MIFLFKTSHKLEIYSNQFKPIWSIVLLSFSKDLIYIYSAGARISEMGSGFDLDSFGQKYTIVLICFTNFRVKTKYFWSGKELDCTP